MYLFVFSGKHPFYDETTFIEHLKFAMEQSEDLGLENISIIKDSLVDIFFQSVAQDDDGSIPNRFSFDILKLNFKADFNFQINPALDSFLMEFLKSLHDPIGAQYFYHVKEGGILKMHTFSRYIGQGKTIDNDYISALDAIHEHVDLLYNKLYEEQILEEHQPQMAKLLLSLKN